MPEILVLALMVIVVIIIAYIGFWIVAKMTLPPPADMIARIIVGVVCLLLLLSLFIPSWGLGLRLGG